MDGEAELAEVLVHALGVLASADDTGAVIAVAEYKGEPPLRSGLGV